MNQIPSNYSQQNHRNRQDSALLFGLFFLFVVMRLVIPGTVIDLFENYTTPGGNPLQKIHPAAYGTIILFLVIVLTQPWPNDRRDKGLVQAVLCMFAAQIGLIVLGLASGRTQSFSYNIDSVVQGALVTATLLYLDEKSRRSLFFGLVAFMILNDLILFGEVLTHQHLLPSEFVAQFYYLYFRPSALLDHPLISGLFNTAMVSFAWLMPWSRTRRCLLSLFFALAAIASTGRVAAIFGTLTFVYCIWAVLGDSVRRKEIDAGTFASVQLAAAFGLVVLGVLIVNSGFVDRFLGMGLFNDNSSETRIKVYEVLRYLTPNQLLFGVQRSWMSYLMANYVGISSAESPIAGAILQYGIIGTLMSAPAMIFYLYRHATSIDDKFLKMGVLAFTIVGFTNTTFISKGPEITFISVLAVTARDVIRRQRQKSQGKKADFPLHRRSTLSLSQNRAPVN